MLVCRGQVRVTTVDMHLLAQLSEEHRLIERVVGALQTYVEERLAGRGVPEDGGRFVRFFSRFVGDYHHHREEHLLVPALIEHLDMPDDRGPIAALTRQHERLAAELVALEGLLKTALDTIEDRTLVASSLRRYSHGLWAHIDAEDSVWFPESEGRLSKHGANTIPRGEAIDNDERLLRDDGDRLVATYPPVYDKTAIRGAGCVICPSYGHDCDGLEREWWRPSEWDELDDHLGDHII